MFYIERYITCSHENVIKSRNLLFLDTYLLLYIYIENSQFCLPWKLIILPDVNHMYSASPRLSDNVYNNHGLVPLLNSDLFVVVLFIFRGLLLSTFPHKLLYIIRSCPGLQFNFIPEVGTGERKAFEDKRKTQIERWFRS